VCGVWCGGVVVWCGVCGVVVWLVIVRCFVIL
jgi:hypothetical protein